MRQLVFISVVTSGLDVTRHEILEVAVVRTDPSMFVVLDELAIKVAPDHLEDAAEETLRTSGYSAAAWAGAVSLDDALDRIAPLLDGAMVAGYAPGLHKSFLLEGWRSTGRTPPRLDEHMLDVAAMAWLLGATGVLPSLTFDSLCEHLGVERAGRRGARSDVVAALEVARRLVQDAGLATRIAALQGDERAIIETLVGRIGEGRRAYGPWRVDDGRDYVHEALLEIFDSLNYTAAALWRLAKTPTERPPAPEGAIQGGRS
jgi:DNA polymerase-3 subunit epsilon